MSSFTNGSGVVMDEQELVKSEQEAIECLEKNKPTSGYIMLQESVDIAIKALEKIQEYRKLGTVEELKAMMDNGAFTGTELAQIAAMQMKLKEYQQLGTVEELRDAREKQIPKKPIWEKGVCYAMTKDGKERREMIPKCPSCLSRELKYSYPCKCGQKLDWSE